MDLLNENVSVIKSATKRLKAHANSARALCPVLNIMSGATGESVSRILSGDAGRTNRGLPKNIPKTCYAMGLSRLALSVEAPLWHPGFVESRGQGLTSALVTAQNVCVSVIMAVTPNKNARAALHKQLTVNFSSRLSNAELNIEDVITAGELKFQRILWCVEYEIKTFTGEEFVDTFLIDQAFHYLFGIHKVSDIATAAVRRNEGRTRADMLLNFSKSVQAKEIFGNVDETFQTIVEAIKTFIVKVAEESGEFADPLCFWFFHAARNEGSEKYDAWPTWDTPALQPELARSLRVAVCKLVSFAIFAAANTYAESLVGSLKTIKTPLTFTHPGLHDVLVRLAAHAMYERSMLDSNFATERTKMLARLSMSKKALLEELEKIARTL